MQAVTPVRTTPAPATTPKAPEHAHAHAHSHDDLAPPPYLSPDLAEERLRQGREAEYTAGTPDPKVAAAGPPQYFRSFDQVKSAMYELQRRYPDFVEIHDIGDSSEKVRGAADRDVLLLRLTNRHTNGAPKPSAFHIAGEHAREIANPELLMRFAEQTLDGYGRDPEATALLDTRVIDLVPIMNPDGHVVIEQGYAQNSSSKLWHRKSTAPPSGVDLNRNYEFHWGGPGASSNPSSDTYRGPSAASEPEVKAVQGHAARTKPGIFIDWHSYSKLNLYPWGDTRDKAPHHDGLDALARKFSTFNHYTPQQSIKLYPTSGTSKDFMYGQLGIPGFTVETGSTFHQSDKEFAQTWAENAPVLAYATKVADAPYERVKGPDVLSVNVTAGSPPGVSPSHGLLQAEVTDAGSGGKPVTAAEWTTDPYAAPGTGTPLNAADGAFNGVRELVRGEVPQTTSGQALVYVRARDAEGNWGPLTPQWLKGTPAR